MKLMSSKEKLCAKETIKMLENQIKKTAAYLYT